MVKLRTPPPPRYCRLKTYFISNWSLSTYKVVLRQSIYRNAFSLINMFYLRIQHYVVDCRIVSRKINRPSYLFVGLKYWYFVNPHSKPHLVLFINWVQSRRLDFINTCISKMSRSAHFNFSDREWNRQINITYRTNIII